MTEPNEPAPPLSRMRFSWQRGTGRPGVEDVRPDAEVSAADAWPSSADDETYDADGHPVGDDVEAEGDAGLEVDEPVDGYEDGYPGDDYQGGVVAADAPDADVDTNVDAVDPDAFSPEAGEVADLGYGEAVDYGEAADYAEAAEVPPGDVDTAFSDVPASSDVAASPDVPGSYDVPESEDTRGSYDVEHDLEQELVEDQLVTDELDVGPDPIQSTEPAVDARAGAAASSASSAALAERTSGRPERSSRRSAASRPSSATAAGRFDVPPPGGRFSGGRGAHTAVKVTVVLSSCLVAVGIVAYLTFSFAVSVMRENTYRLSDADITRYRLSEFPLEQAGRFAADYARICLTHDAEDPRQREALLARYISAGTDARCGWNGEGVQSVIDATWTGESEPIDIPGYAGHARMMTVRVLTSTGSRFVTVPVYVEDLATGDGMRIIGDIGEVPQPTLADPNTMPKPTAPAAVDAALGEALTQGEFFQQFFTAWGDSNGPALERFMTPDATARTRSGLGGALTAPTVRQARVFLPKGADLTEGSFEWKVGMVAEAWVWVDWRSPGAGGEAVETRAYRLQLVKTTQAASPSQEWAVRDIRGGVPDLKGG